MVQPHVNRRTLSFIQVWVSIVLIIAAVICAFTPLITIKTDEKLEGITEMIQELDLDVDIEEMPEEIGVSMPKLISSIGNIINVANSIGDAAESGDIEDLEEIDEDTIFMVAALASVIMDTFDFEGEEGSEMGLGTILNLMITLIAFLYVLVFTFVMPIILAIRGLVALIRALKNMKAPEEVAGKVGAVLPGFVSLPLIYMLFQTFVPGLHYATGVTLIFVFSLIGVICSAVCARLRKYDNEEFKYSLIVQGTGLLGVIGFVVYFFNILKAGFFKAFVMGDWAEVSLSVSMAQAADKGAEFPNGHMITMILIFVALIFMISSVGYFTKKASCVAHAVKGKKGKASDFGLVSAICVLLTYVLPVVVMGMTYDYSDLNRSWDEVVFLTLRSSEEAALNGALVGIIIMLIAEIALIVLKNIFAKKVSKDDMVLVITGKAKTPEEKLADAQAIVAQANAQAAAAQASNNPEV